MMMMDYLEEWTYLAVLLLGAIPFIEFLAIIPLGIVFGLNPAAVTVLGFVGNWITVFLVIALFDRFQQWRARKRADKPEDTKRGKRARKIWEKYGLPGLAIIGPVLIGTHISAALAMTFKAPRVAVTVWLTISMAIWSVLVAVVAYYGFDTLGLIRTDFFNGN